MEYWAHIDGERVQTLKEHLFGAAKLADDFADRFGKREWGYSCGMLHDLGKYSEAFQEKIRTDSNKRAENISLARPSATEEERFSAARTACIHDVITQFSEGYQKFN